MSELIGKDFMIYAEKDSVMQPIVCATNLVLTFDQEIKEATKPGAGRWRSFFAGLLSYNISVDGVNSYDGIKISGIELLNLMIAGNDVRWIASDANTPQYYFTGYFLPASLTLTSPADGFHTFGFTAQGTGPIDTDNPD